jgi:hypothetical protein
MHKQLAYFCSSILVMSLVSMSVVIADGKPNLIGWWKFDGDTLDSSGRGNDGTAIGDPIFIAGEVGPYALYLDGDDYVTIDCIADDVTSNDIALSGWIKTTDLHGFWLSSNGPPGGNVNKALWGIHNGQATVYDGANSAFECCSVTNVSDGMWHMLTYSRKGSTGYLYVDGLLKNIHTADWDFSSTDRWSIGQEWDDLNVSNFLTGTVDDVLIYDRTLTGAQIWDLFNGITPTFLIAENPEPADGNIHLNKWVILYWEPGDYAISHDVYFSENFDDVKEGKSEVFRGNQVSTFYIAGFLEFSGSTFLKGLRPGTTYYWRIDEVNDANMHSPWKGNVWSFTTRPAILIVDPNLVGWWKFDEGYGTIALDWSGYDNHATLVNSPLWVEGYIDGALEFNGSNYAVIDNVADDIRSNNITLNGWVKTTDSHGLWFSCNAVDHGNVALWGIDKNYAVIYDGFDSHYEAYSNTVVSDGEWHMLTYVRNNSTGYIYVDGFLENTHTANYSFDATDVWSIAQEWDSDSSSDFFAGIIDDVRIYDMALAQDQVVELFIDRPATP